MKQETKSAIKTYAVSLAVPLAVGGLSALLTMKNMDLYSRVQTPPLSPPSILFPIVWTLLYLLMGVSSGLVWRARQNDPKSADAGISFYAVSLLFNFVWSILFFNFELYLFSFFWLLILFGLILGTILSDWKVNRAAAYLQIPYAVWVAFAGYLNIGIWYLNR